MRPISERETLRSYNPGAYETLLEIEQTAEEKWKCSGSEAAERYLHLMLNPRTPSSMLRSTGLTREPRRKTSRSTVRDLFSDPESIYNYDELKFKTQLPMSFLRHLMCVMRQRGEISYAQGSTRYNPVFCHPNHPLSLGQILKGGTNASLVAGFFSNPDSIYTYLELMERTQLPKSFLRNLMCVMRKRGEISYAQGSTRYNPIFCHPQHPQSLGQKPKETAKSRIVKALFSDPGSIYTYPELVERTQLPMSNLKYLMSVMRQRGEICYAQGTRRKSPIFCHPEHPQSLGYDLIKKDKR